MSFSGKRFRRTGGSNLEDFLKASSESVFFCAVEICELVFEQPDAPEKIKRLLETNAPVWCFTKIDEETLSFQLQAPEMNVNKTFKLNQEQELNRLDGRKVFVTFSLEGDNVLKQRIRHTDGKIAYFRREFGPRTATMTITMEGADVRKAHIFYEMIE
ncbi:uncharacterized protein isoform X2 [Choristoneura fumiferana]|uniref:uncharacterized protein isoform X2 n=1 Tax=Choristoneura fumiferana TaxID=7141 RepID=UPI003D15425E